MEKRNQWPPTNNPAPVDPPLKTLGLTQPKLTLLIDLVNVMSWLRSKHLDLFCNKPPVYEPLCCGCIGCFSLVPLVVAL